VLGAITNDPGIRDKSVVKSSVIPSAKYSCSGSWPAFANGSTTMDSRGGFACLIGSGADAASVPGKAVGRSIGGASRGQTIHNPAAHTGPTATTAAAYHPRPIFGMTGDGASVGKPAILSGPSA